MIIVKDTEPSTTAWNDLACWLFALFAAWIVIMITVQLVIFCGRIDGLETQLAEMAVEGQTTRRVHADIERRVAYIEGATFGTGIDYWDTEAQPE